jgi:hypothetical protein
MDDKERGQELLEKDYRLAEYKALRTEIVTHLVSIRILFSIGLATAGTMFSVWYRSEEDLDWLLAVLGVGLLGIAVAISVAVGDIHKIGDFIATHIESKSHGAMSWGTVKRRRRTRLYLDVAMVCILVVLSMIAFGVIVYRLVC